MGVWAAGCFAITGCGSDPHTVNNAPWCINGRGCVGVANLYNGLVTVSVAGGGSVTVPPPILNGGLVSYGSGTIAVNPAVGSQSVFTATFGVYRSTITCTVTDGTWVTTQPGLSVSSDGGLYCNSW